MAAGAGAAVGGTAGTVVGAGVTGAAATATRGGRLGLVRRAGPDHLVGIVAVEDLGDR